MIETKNSKANSAQLFVRNLSVACSWCFYHVSTHGLFLHLLDSSSTYLTNIGLYFWYCTNQASKPIQLYSKIEYPWNMTLFNSILVKHLSKTSIFDSYYYITWREPLLHLQSFVHVVIMKICFQSDWTKKITDTDIFECSLHYIVVHKEEDVTVNNLSCEEPKLRTMTWWWDGNRKDSFKGS